MRRHATPGAPPSPNQQIVLDALRGLVREMERRGSPMRKQPIRTEQDGRSLRAVGMGIDALWHYMALHTIGGGTFQGAWKPWHRSTVRDHLNDLTGKGHVTKAVHDRAYYMPVVMDP